jgi:hypothetical protein
MERKYDENFQIVFEALKQPIEEDEELTPAIAQRSRFFMRSTHCGIANAMFGFYSSVAFFTIQLINYLTI